MRVNEDTGWREYMFVQASKCVGCGENTQSGEHSGDEDPCVRHYVYWCRRCRREDLEL